MEASNSIKYSFVKRFMGKELFGSMLLKPTPTVWKLKAPHTPERFFFRTMEDASAVEFRLVLERMVSIPPMWLDYRSKADV